MNKILLAISLLIFGSFSVKAETFSLTKEEGYSADFIIASYEDGISTGLRFTLDKGYKSYWKHPGDGGLPPVLKLNNAKNIESFELSFPAPERFIPFEDIQTIGYKDEVLYPLTIVPKDSSKDVSFTLNMEYGVCKDLCLFGSVDKDVVINSGYLDEGNKAKISKYLSRVDSGLVDVGQIGLLEGKLVFEISSSVVIEEVDVFVNSDDNYRFGKTEAKINDSGKKALIEVGITDAFGEKDISPLDIKKSFDYQVSIKSDDGSAYGKVGDIDFSNLLEISIKEDTGVSIAYIILAAFLGGLILNIMPCVLPILGVKIIGILKKSGESNASIRRKFIATATGIITSFILLAFLIIYIKSLGSYFGWGTHFQHSEFLIFLFIVMLFFGINQLGFFEVRLPSYMANKLSTIGTKNEGLLAHFLTGVLATILATPCSAPFVGTAVSFALSQDSYAIVYIFAFMGLGLAFPYILLILFPKLVSYFPKPGAWMARVRHFMGILLLISAVWIGSIIVNNYTDKPNLIKESGSIVTFSEDRLASLLKNGRTVFVDVTADWCLNCKYNKEFVINTDKVQRAFKEADIVFMQADYTKPSPEITSFLKGYDRYAIPFNAVFKANEDIKILSEKLTIKEVILSLK